MYCCSLSQQIRELQKLAADLENRMKQVGDDIRQREDELEKLQQDLESTPPDDKAYVSSDVVNLSFRLVQ